MIGEGRWDQDLYEKIVVNRRKINNRSDDLLRFMAKVDQDGIETYEGLGKCWHWVASVLKSGYGSFKYEGWNQKAHRAAWKLFMGEIPYGLQVLHHCDNPLCVRLSHLFVGTIQDNVDDKVSKGRQRAGTGVNHGTHTHPERIARGILQGNAKLTEEDVRDIRRRYRPYHPVNGGRALSREKGVSDSLIIQIVKRKIWRHII